MDGCNWVYLGVGTGGHIPHKRIGMRLLYSRQRLRDWLGRAHS